MTSHPQPQLHEHVYTLEHRLNLIAERVDSSMMVPQEDLNGNTYLLRDLALEIVRGTPQHGIQAEDAQVSRVFSYVQNNIEFRDDPVDYDQYQSAGRTANSGASDCDDHTIYVCALLASIGFRTGAKVISPDGVAWHIYGTVEVHPKQAPTAIFTLDTTEADSFPGWEPPLFQRKYEHQCRFVMGRATHLTQIRPAA